MKQHSIVALSSIASGENLPGEYIVAVVHPDTGRLVQRSGTDEAAAFGLLKLLSVLNATNVPEPEPVVPPRPVHPLRHLQETP